MRKLRDGIAVLVAVGTLTISIATAAAVPSGGSGVSGDSTTRQAKGRTGELIVLYAEGVDAATARAAVADAGGTVTNEVTDLGVAQVFTDDAGFEQAVLSSGAVKGVARNHAVGTSRRGMAHKYAQDPALEDRSGFVPGSGNNAGGVGVAPNKPGPETFSHLQWNMDMIDAPEAHAVTKGDGVAVGIIDTGIDGDHPDLAANFDPVLSRNFTTDIPEIDGPCEYAGCVDPPDVDHGGHGTHVAGIVAADDNGLGIMGVAPDADLVNIRAGQDSGYFFFLPTVAALSYAASADIDVVNMSFYTDPWLYNCETLDDYVSPDPDTLSPEERAALEEQVADQAVIREGLLRAVAEARAAGVTLVSSSGNQATDLAADERADATSPDYPPGNEMERVVTDNCLDLPSEAPGVIQVSSIGPSTNKADYSTWGDEGVIDVAAPGGWYRDFIGTRFYRQPENMILSTYPMDVAAEEGAVNKGGGLQDPHFYKRDCTQGRPCAYYQYLQGTSMAAPHVTGVVALIIATYRATHAGASPTPDQVAQILLSSATDTACPAPEDLVYTDEGRPESWTATCKGDAEYNGVYGEGIVNAAAAVAAAATA